MLVSEGYPGAYKKGKTISVPERLDKDALLFHAGTSTSRGNAVTNGGRVLACSAMAAKSRERLEKELRAGRLNQLRWQKLPPRHWARLALSAPLRAHAQTKTRPRFTVLRLTSRKGPALSNFD